jgi:hypothetical protein
MSPAGFRLQTSGAGRMTFAGTKLKGVQQWLSKSEGTGQSRPGLPAKPTSRSPKPEA